MIVVLEPNVLVSALLSPVGPPGKIINFWEADEFGVVISPQLLIELERTLNYPKISKHLKLSQEEIGFFLDQFKTYANVVDPELSLENIEKDPDDNRVLECAITGQASYIVTGDEHLLEQEEYQGVVILSPSSFLSLLEMEKRKPGK